MLRVSRERLTILQVVRRCGPAGAEALRDRGLAEREAEDEEGARDVF